ncbi:MAG: PAS domain S-box protein [Isosphaeraceae bacterium]|nr:PAS domain S-box protein [Isosphaeraceae bacterium]
MSGQGKTVLLVGDGFERTKSLLEAIYGDELRVDRAVEHAAALAELKRGVHEVALVAERFGVSGGLEFIREAVRAGGVPPLILLARHADRAVRGTASQAGAADCLFADRDDADTFERVIEGAIRQKRTEAALLESEARYRLLFEALSNPSYVYDVETLAILDVNRAAVERYGYSREAFLGLKVADIRPPLEVPPLWEQIGLYKGLPHVPAGIWRHRTKDGTLIEAEITSSELGVDGRPARVVVMRDVAEERRTERAVHESERFVRGVLDSLSAHVAVVADDGTILAVNRRWRESAMESDVRLIAAAGEGTNYLAACDELRGNESAAAAELAEGLRAVLAGRHTTFALSYMCEAFESRRWFAVRVLPFLGQGPRRAVIELAEITDRKRAEEALRDSEQRLQAVLDSSKAVIYLKDLSGRYLFVNRKWGEVFKTSKEMVVGKTDYELFPLAIAEAFRDNDRLALEAGRTLEFEENAPHADGLRKYLSIKAPLYDVRGVAYATCGISTDISFRIRAEEALRVSEARFRGAFDSAAIGMAIIAPDGRFLELNGSLCEFTGYTESELLATDFQSITHPEDLEKDVSAFRRLLRGEIRTYQMEKRYIHKQGHELWGLLCVSAVGDARGQPLYVVGQVKDITRRKRAEAANARLLDRLMRLRQLDQAILSAASPHEVGRTALDHLLQLVPCCCGRVDLVDARNGRRTVLAVRGVLPPEQAQALDSAVTGDEWTSCLAPSPASDLPCCQVTGETSRGRASLREPLTYKGRILGALVLYFDRPGPPDPEHLEVVREVADLLAIALRQARLFRQVRRGRRRLLALSQQSIAAQEAERRRLARELHDEIGQSLTALKLGIQAGADASDAALRKGIADDGVQLIDQLIEQVRSLSLDLRPSMLDDFGLLSALRWYVDRLARRLGVEARLTADPPDIRAPAPIETACFRIAQEALTNVTRYASARHVWVDLRREGHELSMTVGDDGIGFDPTLARERAARGTGLGLLGMRERAALLGGRIEILSAPGEGTQVHITIPMDTIAPSASR